MDKQWKHELLQEVRRRNCSMSRTNKKLVGISYVLGMIGYPASEDATTTKRYLQKMQEDLQDQLRIDNDWLNS